VALLLEQQARGRRQVHHASHKRQERIQLMGARAWLACIYCSLVVILAFVVPFVQLIIWVYKTRLSGLDWRFLQLVEHTFLLGIIAACIIACIAFFVAFGQRLSRHQWLHHITRFTSLGYALPGSVLAVGVMIVLSFIDKSLLWPLFGNGAQAGQILVGSVLALLLAYNIRFFSVGLGPIQSSLERIRPSLPEVAQSLGLNAGQVIRRVYLPLITPGLMTALILVLVDVMKEMPATLLLRPFGWDTLAVRVHEMTSEGEWQRAALPALTLVLVSIIPVIIMMRRSRV
jgi:iron(III) transport system permease protein